MIRAAELSSKTYLETEAEVDAFVGKLRAEPLAAMHSGQMARVQSLGPCTAMMVECLKID